MKLSSSTRLFMAAAIVAAAAASCSTEKDSAPAPGSGEASGGVPAASAAIRGETIVSGNPSAADATASISGKQLPPPDPEFERHHQGQRPSIKGLVGAAHCPSQAGPQHPPHHDRRRRFRRPQHFRRRHPDPGHGSRRKERSALQQHPLDRALLADPRRAHYRAQPSLRRLRRDLRAVHRLPRLQQHHRKGQGHHRPHPARQRLRHVLVRQGP